jgi:hypothetical protein
VETFPHPYLGVFGTWRNDKVAFDPDPRFAGNTVVDRDPTGLGGTPAGSTDRCHRSDEPEVHERDGVARQKVPLDLDEAVAVGEP